MKSIGEISIAPLLGGISGILEAQGAGKRQPQEPQHSGPKGRRDRLPLHAAHRLHGPETRNNPNAKNDRFPPSSGKPYGAMWERGFPPLGCARLFGSLRPRARRLTALRLENGNTAEEHHNAGLAAARNLRAGEGRARGGALGHPSKLTRRVDSGRAANTASKRGEGKAPPLPTTLYSERFKPSALPSVRPEAKAPCST